MKKMAAPIGEYGKYLFWLQLLICLFDFHAVYTNRLRKRTSLCPDQGDWCHSSPLSNGQSLQDVSLLHGLKSTSFSLFCFILVDAGMQKKERTERLGGQGEPADSMGCVGAGCAEWAVQARLNVSICIRF